MNQFFSEVTKSHISWIQYPGDGIPIVFIHGLGCSGTFEYPAIVTSKEFQTLNSIIIDLPGSGYSEAASGFDYTITGMADVISELLSSLPDEKFWLYGHSMGGAIAIEVAVKLTGKIAGLILCEPSLVKGGGLFSRTIASYRKDDFIDNFFYKTVNEAHIKWKQSLRIASPETIWLQSVSLVAGTKTDWLQVLHEMSFPKLMIFGEFSYPSLDGNTKEKIKMINTEIIPAAGHFISFDNPEALSNSISNFIICHSVTVSHRPVVKF